MSGYESPFLEQDEVKYPCESCSGKSMSNFTFQAEVSTDEFKDMDDVLEVDFGAFLGINLLEEDDYVRVYTCDECSNKIGYLAKSGCLYIS